MSVLQVRQITLRGITANVRICSACLLHHAFTASFHPPYRSLTHTQVSTAIKPIYTKVHPDLFGQYPRAQHINESSLKQLRSHLDTLLQKRKPRNTTLQFYVRDGTGELDLVSVDLSQSGLRSTLKSVLSSFKLPLAPLSKMEERSLGSDASGTPSEHRSAIRYYDSMDESWEDFQPKRQLKLYEWLVQNMWAAEKKLRSIAPVRKDISRLKKLLMAELGLQQLSSDRATATTRVRGCFMMLLELHKDYPALKHMLRGRKLHFGNVTGVNLAGEVVLGISEVRSQWLSFLQKLPEVDAILSRIPDMQRAVSIGLRNIHVTHRKFGVSVVVRGYGHDLRRLVTSLSDHRGRHGLPVDWPSSLSHLQLVVEPAWGPMGLSPTGQLLVPSSCPPPHLLTFITDNIARAPVLLQHYQQIKLREEELHVQCREVFSLEMLEKDDSVMPEEMISCCERLMSGSQRLSALLSGSRVWITSYYTVMLDGEICIPWYWDLTDHQRTLFKKSRDQIFTLPCVIY
uniref:T-cell activation inhibitor n=3 Tax=Hirondellea gigas TaxID=1518452 RepID=A0A6A7G3J0_9CRUS